MSIRGHSRYKVGTEGEDLTELSSWTRTSYIHRQMIYQQYGQGAQIKCDFHSDLRRRLSHYSLVGLRFQLFLHLPR